MVEKLNRKLTNTLKNIKPQLEKNEQGGLDMGIEFKFLGIGGKLSTENGGTVGIGLGIIGIEYNAEGGGSVNYLNDLYEMKVEKAGCSYVKDFYINGLYTHTEVEKVPDCDKPKEREPKEPRREEHPVSEEEFKKLEESFFDDPGDVDWNRLDIDLFDDYLIAISWEYEELTIILPPGTRSNDGSFTPDEGSKTESYIYMIETYTTFIDAESAKLSFKNFSAPMTLGNWHGSINFDFVYEYKWRREDNQITNFEPREYEIVVTAPQRYTFFNNREEDEIRLNSISTTAFQLPQADRKYKYFGILGGITEPSIAYFPGNLLIEWLRKINYTIKGEYFFDVFDIDTGQPFRIWNSSKKHQKKRLLDIQVFNSKGDKITIKEKDYLPPIPPKIRNNKNMNKCCFTEDDRTLLQLNALALNSLNFPGIVPKILRTITLESGETITPPPAQFPIPENTTPSAQQQLISNLIELKLWQTQVLAELSGGNNTDALDALERIEKVLATEKLLTGGITFPESWLLPGVNPNILTSPDKYRDYLSLWVATQKHLDKVGINEVSVPLDDNGELDKIYPTATHAIQAILESLSQQNSTNEISTLLSLLIAVSKMTIRIYTATAKTGMEVRQIADFLGYPVKSVTEEIPSSLDPSLGAFTACKSKGFDPKKSKYPAPKELEASMKKITKEIEKSPDSAQEILARFIADSCLLISYEKFDNSVDSLLDTFQNKSLKLGAEFEDIS